MASAGRYVGFDITTDPGVLRALALDYLSGNIDGWVAADGNLEVWLIEAFARIAAEVRDVAADVPLDIFRFFGSLVNVLPIDATPASFTVDFAVRDTLGYTVPGGTNVGLRTDAGDTVAFQTLADVVVPVGSSVLTGVLVVAVDAGEYANGLPVSSARVALIDAGLDYVTSVTPTTGETITVGGADAERTATFLGRLSAELQFMAPRPILPADFTFLAEQFAGVGRAITIDGYDPGTNTTGNARTVTVFAVGVTGALLSGITKTALQAYIDGLREVNFVVNVADPDVTQIDVTASVHALHGYDTAAVQAAVVAALDAFLSPVAWGQEVVGGQTEGANRTAWVNRTVVRFFDVAATVREVPGVAWLDAVTLGAHGGSLAAADFTLTGGVRAQLVTPGTMTVTVTAT